MKFSEQWLREWVNPEATTEQLVEQLTMAGLEVDGVEPAAVAYTGVVVGEVLSVEPHPDADKLRVCQVAGGEEPVQVVCGASNVAAGVKGPFATIGAVLPGDFKIKKSKLRGELSMGMLCGASEIGLEDEVDGLMILPEDAPVGMDFREYLGLNDTVIEVDLTPNRGDCLGIKGLAREVGVLNKAPVSEVSIEPIAASIDDVIPVELQAPEDCPRYASRIIKDVDLTAKTPMWMVEKLRRSGIRSIDAVVDVTNYILLELGQPMHAFDLSQIAQSIVVRKAQKGEVLTLLDEQELKLKEDSLVIADKEKALALAGIMGGAQSGVNAETTDILLEAAFFEPVNIAGRARNFGLHTDSSHRFERGVDYELPSVAIERATQLLLDIVGGQAGPVSVTESTAHLPNDRQVNLRKARISKVLGFELPDQEVEDILTRLGMAVSANAEGWDVAVPSYRFDVSIEADLLEELARVYGYNNLPVKPVVSDLNFKSESEVTTPQSDIRRLLTSRGYQESITYSFVEPKQQSLFDPNIAPVVLQNPISADMSVMRTSLWPGLCSAMVHNTKRQRNRVRLFEMGQKFIRNGENIDQPQCIAGLLTGARDPENWTENGDLVDFYDLKGDVEAILALSGTSDAFVFEAAEHNALHPGQSAHILRDGNVIGWIGTLHPQIQKSLGVSQPVYVFELLVAPISSGVLPSFNSLSKFPEVRRDLAILIEKRFSAEQVLQTVRSVAGENLKNLLLFDVYEGKGIDLNSKSLALGLTFQHPERTFSDEDVNQVIDAVIKALGDEFGAILRN